MSLNEQAVNKLDAHAEAYDSGVTNGDVDWLFRGKSKKLTKKMNLPKDLEKDKENKEKLSPEQSKEPVPQPADIPANTPSPESEALKPASSTKKETPKEGPTKTSPPVKTSPPTKDDPKEEVRPNSKMEKIFRTRSSSLTRLAEKKDKPAKEKPKFNLINYSGTSFDGSSFYNQSFENNYLGPVDPPKAPRDQSVPKTRSRSSSSGSNTSIPGKEKKSLFSSLSSKFKSSSSDSTAKSSDESVSPSTLRVNSASSGSSPKQAHKLNPNLLGSGNSKDKEDFSSFYSGKPPMEMGVGIPIKKRNSIQEQTLPGSLDKLSSSANSFNTFFKRRTSTSSTASGQSQASTCRVVLNKNPNKEKIPLKELADVSLKRVNFAIDKLIYDPQQQIPSRRPKKGNVLIPEDLLAPPPRLSQGISLNDGNKTADQASKYTEKELNLAIEAQKRALVEAEKHSSEAHISAKRIALEVAQYKAKSSGKPGATNETITSDEGNSSDEEDDNYGNSQMPSGDRGIEIDKPLHLHENYFDEDTMELDISNLSLELIYTRCCHLREILPIPATLKQLKNKSKPLSVLKMLNPKPTLIDVLSFSDFIAIVPIITVIFDNVTMTTEMLKHILSSLAYGKSLEKLSLRNVPIDEMGWKYLCKFMSRNHTIKKLDISQQRIKSDLKVNLIRSSMNWKLLIKSLILRGGIEELVINGCKLTDEIFQELIESAVSISTYRLGIASCELNEYKTNVVCNWLKKPETKCVGVDVAFNDLSQGQLKYFIDFFNSGNLKLIFCSFYQTNLSNIDEAAELLKSLTKVKTLRFLDLSSLPDLFPGIISKLNVYLPQFENLKRIHFDLNELTSQSIIALAEILPRVPGLLHVSFLGNRNLNNSVAASIYAAIKNSRSIFNLDLDYDLINDQLNQRIAFYLMRNMDNVIHIGDDSQQADNRSKSSPEEEELMFDGSLLMEAAEKLLVENESSSPKVEDIKLTRIISTALIERTTELRSGIHKTIDTLFEKRNEGTLSLEGKENLIRFCLLDASLEKLVHLFEEQAKKTNSVAMTPSASFEDRSDAKSAKSVPSAADNEEALSPNSKAKVSEKKKNHPIINLSDNELLHQSSSELLTAGPILSPRNTETLNTLGFLAPSETSNFQPHQVVVESNSEGQNIPIDHLTGRPVLMRSISQTSTHAKEQELEEGEFHRWGFFIQQRNNSNNDLSKENKEKEADPEPVNAKTLPKLNVLPSGTELRDAIIQAKGIDSITALINKINNDRVSLDKIYSVSDEKQQQELSKQFERVKLAEDGTIEIKEEPRADNESIDSMDEPHEVAAVVDEAYDKLLNEAERVRSNK